MAHRTAPCPYACAKPTPHTLFIAVHPFRTDVEIRQCTHCGKKSFFPTGRKFKTLKEDTAPWELPSAKGF